MSKDQYASAQRLLGVIEGFFIGAVGDDENKETILDVVNALSDLLEKAVRDDG